MNTPGPLILGANGRIGQLWQGLWRVGAWPARAKPVWHGRNRASWHWDMSAPPPDKVPPCSGMIVLAGRTTGSDEDLSQNTALALTALDLAAAQGVGPVLLCSSSAVYGRASGPQSEDMASPANPYGKAKLAMERAAAAHPHPSCCLRIANVAGADMAMLNAARGPVTLDHFQETGETPKRMYIGPASLLRVMLDLIALSQSGTALPQVLNVARPGSVTMGGLLDAAGATWSPRAAPPDALPELTLDLGLLHSLLPMSPATASSLALEARLAGWVPAP